MQLPPFTPTSTLTTASMAGPQRSSSSGGPRQERVEIVFDELRRVRAGNIFGQGKEGRRVLQLRGAELNAA